MTCFRTKVTFLQRIIQIIYCGWGGARSASRIGRAHKSMNLNVSDIIYPIYHPPTGIVLVIKIVHHFLMFFYIPPFSPLAIWRGVISFSQILCFPWNRKRLLIEPSTNPFFSYNPFLLSTLTKKKKKFSQPQK